MNDFYVEQIVARKPRPMDMVTKIFSIAVTVLLIFMGMSSLVALVLGLVSAGLCYFFLPSLSIEFEYLYLSKELQIDKIMSKQRRKTAGNFQLEKMEIMAPAGSDRLSEYKNRKMQVFDYTSGEKDRQHYVIILNDGEFKKVYIDPNEQLVKAIKDQFPRKVFEV